MQGFNQELQIGQPAMIIATNQAKNSHLIGSVVVVEEFWYRGQDVTEHFIGAAEARRTVRVGSDVEHYRVLVSGCKVTGKCTSDFYMNPGFTQFDPKCLMPLPPLKDEDYSEDVGLTNDKKAYT